jgi:hypothetical protein
MSLLIAGSYPKRIVDYVRLRKSAQRGGVDMQVIVSAICARAGRELRPLPLLFPYSMLGHASVTVRAPRCGKAAAFAGEHRNPPHLKESGGSHRGPTPFLQESSRRSRPTEALGRQWDYKGPNQFAASPAALVLSKPTLTS